MALVISVRLGIAATGLQSLATMSQAAHTEHTSPPACSCEYRGGGREEDIPNPDNRRARRVDQEDSSQQGQQAPLQVRAYDMFLLGGHRRCDVAGRRPERESCEAALTDSGLCRIPGLQKP